MYLLMSLEEEQLPPSTVVGRGRPVQRAWEGGGGPSLESSEGNYATFESSTGYNVINMDDVSGGDQYWSQGEGRSSKLEEENERLKEDLMQVRVELEKYKHQVESREPPNPTLSPDGSKLEEVSKQESELEIARQKIEELEQEVELHKLLLKKQSISTSPSLSKGQGPAASDSELRRRLEEVECDRDEVCSELSGVKDELEMVKTERDKVKCERDEFKGEYDDIRDELEEVKSKLRLKESELECAQNNKSIPNGRIGESGYHLEELDKTKRELETVVKTLDETKDTLRRKEEELEDARRKPTARRLSGLTATKLEKAVKDLRCKTEASLY